MNEVDTLSTVQQKVKEKIQQTFAELIPESVWQGMVAAEIEAFTKVHLPKIIRAEAEKAIIELLKQEFAKQEWAEQWGINGIRASAMVSGIIKDSAPELVASLFGGIIQQVVNNLRNNPIRGF